MMEMREYFLKYAKASGLGQFGGVSSPLAPSWGISGQSNFGAKIKNSANDLLKIKLLRKCGFFCFSYRSSFQWFSRTMRHLQSHTQSETAAVGKWYTEHQTIHRIGGDTVFCHIAHENV
jgi:hypothetical protein